MKQYFNICNLYILLWCIFDYTFALSMPISRPLFALIFAITVYYTVYTFANYKFTPFMKGLTLLLLMFTVYGIVLLFTDVQLYIDMVDKSVSKYVYLITVYKSLLPIFPFFVFAKKGLLNESVIKKWLPVFIVVTIALFYSTNNAMIAMSEIERKEFTNNTGYVFVSLLPYLFFLNNRRFFQYVVLIILTLFVILSMKRGAILCLLLFIVWFIYRSWVMPKSKNKFVIIINTILFVGITYFWLGNLYEDSDFFRYRIEQTINGETSGRDGLYNYLWFYYQTNMSEIQQLFGMGAESTLLIGENYAHNDWLEILINNGIFGVCIYVIYWICFYKTYRQLSYNGLIYSIFGSVLVIYLAKTFYSMSYGGMTCFASLCIGYCIANGLYNTADNIKLRRL